MTTSPVRLDDKYTQPGGRVLLTGQQALIRVVLEQRRIDRARGLNTGVLVTGYPGSPLGGLDQEFSRARAQTEEAGVVFQPGLNEELAATAVAGTQLVDKLPGRRVDGITGIWYGKNPGLDRAADAIRLANVAGTAPLGGAVAWIGDDPGSKSSTIPSSSELLCQSLGMPFLTPTSVAEILTLGLHAIELSRVSGLWVGLKIVADLADACESVDLDAAIPQLPTLGAHPPFPPAVLSGPDAVAAEYTMLTAKDKRAREYARAANLNEITHESEDAELGIVASGTGYAALLRALDVLQLDSESLERRRIRIIRISMPSPVDNDLLRSLTSGLSRILVIEDKKPIIETQLRAALYGTPDPAAIVGREDERGKTLLSPRGTLDADDVAVALNRVLDGSLGAPASTATSKAPKPRVLLPVISARAPFFCSGCPHNISTRASDDTLVGGGIGCHAMVTLAPEGRGRLVGLSQMGGEGGHWIGLAPFTDDTHFTQNIGDGTFHHSGSLAIRGAVAAGATMTYKILYNDAVAMTGGQHPQGQMDVPTLTKALALEGVKRTIVVTPEIGKYRRVKLDPSAKVMHRDKILKAESDLAATSGVTVLIYDDRCAAEKRKLRKRGTLETPETRVVINQRVCEGCGDCGNKSSCLSVHPIDTEFGRKTQIDQATCNFDMSCIQGDCPAFMLVTKSKRPSQHASTPQALSEPDPTTLPHPSYLFDREVVVRLAGIGGTGVVTASRILQMAAHIGGNFAAGVDQIGLAQKGGPVISDIRLSPEPISGSIRATAGGLDCLIALDILAATERGEKSAANPDRTVAVVNSDIVPTSRMVMGLEPLMSVDGSLDQLAAATRHESNIYLDATRLATEYVGNGAQANFLLIGAAFQAGEIPLKASDIEAAIRLNGVSVDETTSAFRWGRQLALPPEAPVLPQAPSIHPDIPSKVVSQISRDLLISTVSAEAISKRADELSQFQNGRLRTRYLEELGHVRRLIAERTTSSQVVEELMISHANNLFKVLAYKDEYEVARLHLNNVERSRVEEEFGRGARVRVLLHPPILRYFGMNRKVSFGRSATVIFRVLHSLRRLRGTPFDLFGHTKMRRLERSLAAEYSGLVQDAIRCLTDQNHDLVAELVALPDLVRGYEDIKIRSIDAFRERGAALLSEIRGESKSQSPVDVPV